jgi:hypothetical protein
MATENPEIEKLKTYSTIQMEESLSLMKKIDDAKTHAKKQFYKKKLIKSNKQMANLVSLYEMLKIQEETPEEKQT